MAANKNLKEASEIRKGTVFHWNKEKEYGFIRQNGVDRFGPKVFFHCCAIKSNEKGVNVEEGDKIEYVEQKVKRGPFAAIVTGPGGAPVNGANAGFFHGYKKNIRREGGEYKEPSTHYDKDCGGYSGKYGEYGALMRN